MSLFRRRRPDRPTVTFPTTYLNPGPEAERVASDIATYAGIHIMITSDPDNPEALKSLVKIDGRAPCMAAAAASLHHLAEQFERLHAANGCHGGARVADPRESGPS